MDRFLRHQAPASGEASSNVPQPTAPTNAAKHTLRPQAPASEPSSSSVPQPTANRNVAAKTTSTASIPDLDVEVSSCSSETEVGSVELEVGSDPRDYRRTLEELQSDQPEAIKWLQQEANLEHPTDLRSDYLRQRAQKILKLMSSMTTQTTQRSGKGKTIGLAKFLHENSVRKNKTKLQQKAAKVLKAVHKAARKEAPNLDNLLRDLASVKET